MSTQTTVLADSLPAGVKCPVPGCRSRDSVAYPRNSDDETAADYRCEDCGHEWNTFGTAPGKDVVIGVSGNQPDIRRENVLSVHAEYDVEVSEELARETRFDESEVVDVAHVVYISGDVGRIVSENIRIKHVGPAVEAY